MADYITKRNSNTQLLQELEALSETLYQQPQPSATRRTASLALPRTSVPPIPDQETTSLVRDDNDKPRSRRMSLSPWRSRPKLEDEEKKANKVVDDKVVNKVPEPNSEKKSGLWSWKPIRALAHIGKQKLSCLFSVEVVAVQGLPASMNGLRLSVCVRKKETKDGAVQTMPSRVSQGAADFEETLFIRCHVYYTPNSNAPRFKFEPRPFQIYLFAVDAEELDFGKNSVYLSEMIQESIEKSIQGSRIRQWDTSFPLSGKAKGGELVLKLGFQIMEKDGGVGIYSQGDQGQSTRKNSTYSSPSFARKQSKTSFSVPSPRMSALSSSNWTPSQAGAPPNLQGIDELNLDDEPVKEQESKAEDLDLPDFDVVDKGVEIQDKEEATKEVVVANEDKEEEKEEEEAQSEGDSDKRSVASEVVKEVVHDQFHITRMTELDSIAQQIKALESMFKDEIQVKADDDSESQKLDADEETVTREFLQMLEDSGATNQFKTDHQETHTSKPQGDGEKKEGGAIFIPDLAKGLGCVVQTRNGGFLAAMNPLNTTVSRNDTPKLAMQISKPFVLPSISSSANGFEVFQRMACIGVEEFSSKILSLMPMEELMGKTAEQIAFEGIASAIIQGRNKEVGASSSAALTVAAVKSMAIAMNASRKERISTGIWNITEEDKTLTVDEILAFSLQKMEEMTIEALKIQADVAEEGAPFDVSPNKNDQPEHPLESAVPLEDWAKDGDNITISVVVQLRDPLRQYEAVGGPMIALIQAIHHEKSDGENKFKIGSLQVGGLRVRSGGGARKNAWDSEKQRLTAMQWLVAYGLAKIGKRIKKASIVKGEQDLLWSISSRVMADMWLKSIRNPDIRFTM